MEEVIIVVIGTDQKVTHINKQGCAVLGCKEDEIVGGNWFNNFVPEGERAKVIQVFERLISGRGRIFEYSDYGVVTRSGEEKMIVTTVFHMFNSKRIKFIGDLRNLEAILG